MDETRRDIGGAAGMAAGFLCVVGAGAAVLSSLVPPLGAVAVPAVGLICNAVTNTVVQTAINCMTPRARGG